MSGGHTPCAYVCVWGGAFELALPAPRGWGLLTSIVCPGGLHLGSRAFVFFSCDFLNTWPQTSWLKPIEANSYKVWRPEVRKQGVGRAVPLWGLQGSLLPASPSSWGSWHSNPPSSVLTWPLPCSFFSQAWTLFFIQGCSSVNSGPTQFIQDDFFILLSLT